MMNVRMVHANCPSPIDGRLVFVGINRWTCQSCGELFDGNVYSNETKNFDRVDIQGYGSGIRLSVFPYQVDLTLEQAEMVLLKLRQEMTRVALSMPVEDRVEHRQYACSPQGPTDQQQPQADMDGPQPGPMPAAPNYLNRIIDMALEQGDAATALEAYKFSTRG